MAQVPTTPGHDDRDSGVRSSFEIMGCLTPNNRTNTVPGVGATMSRPPSSMPHFGFVEHNSTVPGLVAQNAEHIQGDSPRDPVVQFSAALFLFLAGGLSLIAAIAVRVCLTQVGTPGTAGLDFWLILSIVLFVLGSIGLGYVLCVSPGVLGEVKRKARAFPSTIHWPAVRMPSIKTRIRWPQLHWPFNRMRRPGDIELEDLENRPPRPPTPYPAVEPVSTLSPQPSQQGHNQAFPLNFPFPPTSGVNRMNSAVSRMSNTSFRSDPRSVSPLSDAPPTPPPKDPGISRFQSREPLLSPAVSGGALAQSDTRNSILTTLCEAVQLSSPGFEPGRPPQNYSPLAMANSPATGTTGGNSASVQSPKPAYPVELASPSRSKGKERED